MTNGLSDLPEQIGPFQIRRVLGEGGMGVVYLGESMAAERVAVKRILDHILTDEARRRFAREVESLKVVYGPRVVPYMDADLDGDEPWLAVKYIPGPTLREFVADKPLEPVLVAILGAALAEGLTTIHEAKRLHRDLKPANIILGHDGPYVIDFGLATLTAVKVERAEAVAITKPGIAMGTLVFMPPEQVLAEDLTTAADVYALGATLQYAATRHHLYEGTSHVVAGQILSPSVEPDLSGLADSLRPVITAMLERNPTDRPDLKTITRELSTVVTSLGYTPARARDRLHRMTADVAREPEPSAAPDPATRRSGYRSAVRTGSLSPAGAQRAASRLREDYARAASL